MIYSASSKLIILNLFLCSCANTHPYVEARHISDPTINKDGWNDLCGGAIYIGDNLQLKGGLCYNVTGYHGTRLDVGALWVIK